jgi:glycine betaine/proline transport system ATP-binding protein
MREPTPEDPTDGPKLDVTMTVSKAAPALAASEKPVCAVENGKIVGIVDREAVFQAIADERGD